MNISQFSKWLSFYGLMFSFARKWQFFNDFFFKQYVDLTSPFEVFYLRYAVGLIRSRLVASRSFLFKRFRGLKVRRFFSKSVLRRFMKRIWYFKTRKYRLARRDFTLFFRLNRRYRKRRICRIFRSKYVQMIRFVYREPLLILRQNKAVYFRFDKFPYKYFFRISDRRNLYKMKPFGWNRFYLKKDKTFGYSSRYFRNHTVNLLRRGYKMYRYLLKLTKKPVFNLTIRPFILRYAFEFFLREFFFKYSFTRTWRRNFKMKAAVVSFRKRYYLAKFLFVNSNSRRFRFKNLFFSRCTFTKVLRTVKLMP
jgi:hypothetical protein